MTEITKISAGVIFESDVLFYIDQLALEQGRSRSFIINQIIRIYSRMVKVGPPGKAAEAPEGILPERRINF